MKRCTLYIEEDLLNGPLVKKSTNPMSNIPFPGDGMQTGVTEGPPVFKQASSE
ncbi:hypothetical protein NXV02_22555 [Bacteroides ovatus]|nr:hypothetical protein [Bacteroides ovatus]MCS2815346.1 hypothetical protein [Bacteroides ovatus]